MAGAGEIDHIQIVLLDDPVEMGIDEILARTGAPVADDFLLDLFGGERAFQQGVVQKIELAGGKVVGGAPVHIHDMQFLLGSGLFLDVRHKNVLLIFVAGFVPASTY